MTLVMLTITLISLVLAIPLSSIVSTSSLETTTIGYTAINIHGESSKKGKNATISATLFTRIVTIALLFAAIISYNGFPLFNYEINGNSGLSALSNGLGLYSGLIITTTVTQTIEVFLLISGALVLIPWYANPINRSKTNINTKIWATIPEYPLIILFTIMGSTFLLASSDLVSIYLSIELQSFGVYILAAIYRNSESATIAGLKYFLLGALSSAFILLGSALVYNYTGLTNLNSIFELLSVSDSSTPIIGVIIGFTIISVGLLFKVASAPFHYWAPDVYDGTPTIVTTWLTVIPKISIFVFILELFTFNISNDNIVSNNSENLSISIIGTNNLINNLSTFIITNLLLTCAFLSLIIGTIVGLGQYRIKRLLAYSTISHVGFLLLALGMSSTNLISIYSNNPENAGGGGEESVSAFLFYIVQYTLTNINTFFILLAFGYIISEMYKNQSNNINGHINSDIQFTSELQGQFRANPILGLSFAICLFSIAGIPPLVGFFAKYTVLYSAIQNGYIFLAIVAILASVVSAVYYLRIIRVIHFDIISDPSISPNSYNINIVLTSLHSYIIASLTLFILLFALYPNLILNSTSIMALSIFTS